MTSKLLGDFWLGTKKLIIAEKRPLVMVHVDAGVGESFRELTSECFNRRSLSDSFLCMFPSVMWCREVKVISGSPKCSQTGVAEQREVKLG